MKRIDIDLFKSEFAIRQFGGMGWYRSDDIVCSICGKSDKYGFKLDESGIGRTWCMRCSEGQSLSYVLDEMGHSDMLYGSHETNNQELVLDFGSDDEEESDELEEISLPSGLKALPQKQTDYLLSRKFTEEHFKRYNPKIGTIMSGSLKGYIVFEIRQRGKLVAYLARSTRSKKWHIQNEQLAKEGKEQLQLRYKNATGIDFTKILGNSDLITPQTTTVILVEGMFDSVGVEVNGLPDDTVCCYTFGSKISSRQLNILKTKGVENIIIMYDDGTMRQVKKHALEARDMFESVWVCPIKGDKDPNDMDKDDFDKLELLTPMEYYLTI